MQLSCAVFLLALVAAPAAAQSGADANPLNKVIQLLTELRGKVVKEGEEEDLAYRKYTDWCDDAASNKRFEIKTAESKKQDLEAEIGKETAAIAESDSTIEKLVADIATQTKDLNDATVIREKEAKEFAANEAELMDTINTLSRAISIISKEMAKNPAAFAQLDTSSFTALTKSLGAIMDAASLEGATKQKLMAFVQSSQKDQEDSEEDPSGAPAATVYKSHSSDILDVLEDLKEKAEEELAALRKAETNAKQNFEMLAQSLNDANKNAEKDKADEEAAKKEAEEAKATAEKDLAMTEKLLADSNEVLASVKSDCMQVAADHEATVAGRNDEINAIDQATKILKDTSSGAVQQTYDFLQVARSQLRTGADLKKAEVLSAVQRLAKEYHSVALSQLASRISAVMRLGSSDGEDPFVKVKALIVDLIAKLEAEASAAAEEKAYCDDQMAKTEEKKSELEEDISALVAKIDKAAATSAALKEDVKELQAELAEIAKTQAEMDDIRGEQKAAYDKAVAELTLGLEGVRKALTVLRNYYQGGGASLIQDEQPAKPVKFEKATGAGDSIIGILEVVESDFAKEMAKEEAQESDAKTLYDKTTQENKVSTTMKQQDVKYKVQEFKGLDKAIADMTSEKATKDSQLKAVLEYYDKVKDRCIAKPESYEERKARRESEIAGLKEALSILETDTALVQVKRAHRFMGKQGKLQM
jgi:hypothetical protein